MISHGSYKYLVTYFLSFLVLVHANAQTQWSDNGVLVSQATSTLVHLSAIPDGNGGVFITYENNPTGDANIYARWIDGSGNFRWGTSGIAVNSAGLDQKHPAIAPDGAGGVFIAWQDVGSGDIYAQHLNANGTLLWGIWGIVVCSAAGEQSLVEMVSDGNGGAILVWIDKRNGTASDIYAQRINGSGTPLWTANGVPVTTATETQSYHVIVGDGSGGVFVAWQDYRNGNYDIYAQRITNSGSQAWTNNGVAVCSTSGTQTSPAVDTSGNKLIISWDDYRSGTSDIYAQALDSNGTPLWTAGGIPISVAANAQNNNTLVRDGSGGAIIAWTDNRTNYDIYAQRIDKNGSALWTANGLPVNQSAGLQYAPKIVCDGSEGALIVWNDNRTGSDINLYAQHVNSNGTPLWPEDGLPIVVQAGTQQQQVLVSDESGGTFVLWQDGRDGRSDIYAQLINDNLSFVTPVLDALWAGGQSKSIEWQLRTSQTRFDHLTLRYSTSAGDGFPYLIEQNIPPSQYTQSWTPSGINSATVRIRIQTHNAQDSVLCTYESPSFTIDSDPPNAFHLLSPLDKTTVERMPTFQWESTTDNLSGLDHYELWIDGTRTEDNLSTTSYTLGEAQKLALGQHSWTVKAVDRAGLVRQALTAWNVTASEDNTPPNPFNLLSPGHNTWTKETNPTFTWEATSDTGRGLQKYQFYLDEQLTIDNIPPTTTSTNEVILSPGDHSWRVTAVDSVQNSISTEPWTIRMDNVPPRSFSLLQPPNDQWTRDATPTFAWQATSDTSTGIGLAEYQLWINDQLVVDHISKDLTSITLSESQRMNDGSHTWVVVAKDSLGNSRTSNTAFIIKVDETSPHAFILSYPQDNSFINTTSPKFTWQPTTDDVSGLKEYELWIDGLLNVDNLSTTTSFPQSPLTEGLHTWYVQALDNAGNISTTAIFDFVIDTTPPEPIVLISPVSDDTLHTNYPTFTWHTVHDALSGFNMFQFFIDGQLVKDNLTSQDTTVTVTAPLDNGLHHWKVIAWDKAGNQRSSANPFFTISINPPQITSSGTAAATEDIPFTYTATAYDPDADPLIFTFKHYPTWLVPSGNQICGTPVEGTQDTSFLVVVTDNIFSDSLKVTLHVQAVNDPPVITSPSNATATEDIPFSYTATATDPEKDNIAFVFKDFPTWLVPSGNRISGTPTEGKQDTSFVVIASDGSLTDTLKVLLTVIPVNDPPVITSPSTAAATEGSLFVYRASATDVDGPRLIICFADYPSWLRPSGPEIMGTPCNACPDTSFKVIASDGLLSDTLLVNVTVTQINDPPLFLYAFPKPIFYDVDTLKWELALDEYVTDPDDPDSTLSWFYTLLNEYDVSVTIHEKNHIATINAVHILGDLQIAFTVTDPHGASATDTLNIRILKTDVKDPDRADIPDDFVLYNNYPNPFNPETTIQYGIPHACRVTLRIYNMLGREVALLVDEQQKEGMYKITWNASDLPSGIYFYRIQAGKWQKVQRMILMK